MATTKKKATKPRPVSNPKPARLASQKRVTTPLTIDKLVMHLTKLGCNVKIDVEEPKYMLGNELARGSVVDAEMGPMTVNASSANKASPASMLETPSEFQINAPVFIGFNASTYVPAVVIGVSFADGHVSYDLVTDNGPLLRGVWSGWITPRDVGRNSTSLDLHHVPVVRS